MGRVEPKREGNWKQSCKHTFLNQLSIQVTVPPLEELDSGIVFGEFGFHW